MQDDCVELSVLSAEERRGESRRGHWPERLTFTRSETDTTSTVITVSTGVVHGLARAPTARARVIIITNYATIMQILLLTHKWLNYYTVTASRYGFTSRDSEF